MIKGRWIALICAALLAMSGCGAREKGAQSSEEASPQSSQASQQEPSQAKEADPSPEGESGEPVDEAALKAVLDSIAQYEPDTAGSSLKIVIVAAKLLDFSESYNAAQKQALETGAENYLTALTGEALGLFSDNLPYVDQTVREILAGGEEIEARLEEAGNPLENESYSPDLYESVYAVLNDALAARIAKG